MSQTATRSAIFLEEMGVGAHWSLRNRPAALALAEVVEAAPEPVADAERPVPAVERPVAAPPVHAQPAVEQPVPAPTPEAVPPPVMPPRVAAEVPAAPRAAAEVPAAPRADDDSTAWFDEAPVPARAAPVSDEAIAAMDWAQLRTAVASCTRCDLCATRRNAVNGRGPTEASWIALAAGPSRLDEKDQRAIAGEAGQLLDNMLKAIVLKPDTDVYVTNLVKCRPSGEDGADRPPTIDELAACRPYLHRELELTGAAMAMTFGQHAARGLMMGPAARGKVMRYGAAGLPVVATYHPDDLLRRPEDKAKAWGDLCLAKAARD
jgi:DNA polymerase